MTHKYPLLLAVALILTACDSDPDPALDGSTGTDGGVLRDTPNDDVSADAGPSDAARDTLASDAFIPDNDTPPAIRNFRVTGAFTDRVYFDSDKPIVGADVTGFTISGQTIEEVVVVAGSLDGHYFRLSDALTFWDNNTVRYEGGSDLRDRADRPLVEFTLSYIENHIPEPTSTTERYVTSDASGGGNGTSEGDSWTMEEAFANAEPGMTVWMKAGDYGAVHLQVSVNGTEDSPIKFIGYKNTTNDIASMYYAYGDGALDASEMPLLDGNNSGDGIVGGAVDYYIIRNVQLRRYEVALYNNNGTGVIFDNSIVKDGARDFGYGMYQTGTGSRCRITNSIAINATGSNFSISGSNNLMRNLESYSNNFSNPTDYYFGMGASNNISMDTYAKRDGDLSHSGHGMSVQTSATVADEDDPGHTEHNLIENHTAVNMGKIIEFRHGGARYNVGRNIVGYPEGDGGAGWIEIRDDASFNIVENANIESPDGICVYFSESVEIGVGLGHDNLIQNLICRNSNTGIYVASDQGLGSLTNNRFYNSVFSNVGTLFEMRDTYPTSGNEFINNIVVDSPNLSNIELTGWTFEHSNFHNSFSTPSGPNNVSIDPAFASDTDFHLSASSPVEVTEGGRTLLEAVFDMDRSIRTPPYSMGAFEY